MNEREVDYAIVFVIAGLLILGICGVGGYFYVRSKFCDKGKVTEIGVCTRSGYCGVIVQSKDGIKTQRNLWLPVINQHACIGDPIEAQ